MPVDPWLWPSADEFRNRERDLAPLQAWWDGPERMPYTIYGRRRVGKSWLFRRFAHGKPAIVLVAEQLATTTQLQRFADVLAPALGVRPEIASVPELFRVLYRLARDAKTLVVIDEFPWLLPSTAPQLRRELSAIQAVLEEERDASQIKLVLCGSAISTMEGLHSVGNPLHGRLLRLELRPLDYADAQPFLSSLDPLGRIERYAMCGGMPRYLAELGEGELRDVVCSRLLDYRGPLHDEARIILEQELREPGIYFSILEQLAHGAKSVEDIASGARLANSSVSRYLNTLRSLRIVVRRAPIGAPADTRRGRWDLVDPFVRLWFRCVFPYQAELEAGLKPEALFDDVVEADIPQLVAAVFEDLCRAWARRNYGDAAQRYGPWWGDARHDLRRSGERLREEIDVVGMRRKVVTVVGECRWRAKPAGESLLREIRDFKLPALRQTGLRVADDPQILLFSRAGFSGGLQRRARESGDVHLVDAAQIGSPA